MRDQWLALTNSQRAPLISRLRDQNPREREERGEAKKEQAAPGERTLNFTPTRTNTLSCRDVTLRILRSLIMDISISIIT